MLYFVSISGIVSSPTSIDRAELRFEKTSENATEYSAIKMNVTKIPTTSAYLVSARIPQNELVTSSLTYWIWVQNHDQLTSESDKYSVGVVPSYDVTGTVGLVMPQNVPESTTQSPTIYITNTANGTIYGIVSLLVDGNETTRFPAQSFDVGTSAIQLEWNVPKAGHFVNHTIQAKAEFYGKFFETKPISVNAFPLTMSTPLSKLGPIQQITDQNDIVIASPYTLYSSLHNLGHLTFKVISPEGNCIIGNSVNCLVSDSTVKNGVRIVNMTSIGQNYDVYYSGSSNILERFTLTSSEPIFGQWHIMIEKDGIEQKDLENSVYVKIKYTQENNSLVTSMPK